MTNPSPLQDGRRRVIAWSLAIPSALLIAILVTQASSLTRTRSTAPVSSAGNGSISGLVFDDADEDGEVDPGDAGIAQQMVILTNPTGTQELQRATSGPDGTFRFDHLAGGAYRITLVLTREFKRTTDNSFWIEIARETDARAVRFGLTSS